MNRVGKDVNWLRHAAATARDQTLTQVVSMLDGLRHRGEADKVLDLARQRLRSLRPPRPLGFGRLLFLPLDGAIVPSAQWRRGEARVPRSTLGVLAAAVLARLGPNAAAITQACEGRTTADPQAIAAIGRQLWPAAASALPATPPPDWEDTCLTSADYEAIAALCRPVWMQATSLWAAMREADSGPPDALVQTALVALLPAGPTPFSAALASLLQRANAPGKVLAVAARLDPMGRTVAQQHLDVVLDQPLPEFDRLDMKAAIEEANSVAHRLDDLEKSGLLNTERQRRLAAQRRAADEGCRERFLSGAEQLIVSPAAQLIHAPTVRDEDVAALEASARSLRALEMAGRRLGHPSAYDRALNTMCEALGALVSSANNPDGLQPIDLARSVELLAGPEAAAALLERQAT